MANCFKLIISEYGTLFVNLKQLPFLPDMTTTNRTCLKNFAKTHGG